MFKNGFKYGFGCAIGYILGAAVMKAASEYILKTIEKKEN